MIQKIFKNTLILGLPLLALSAYATITPENEVLAHQCKELSQTVATLVISQQKSICIDKLTAASKQIDAAGEWILQEAIGEAKSELDKSILSLRYAELNSCNHYIQISHSKFEAKRIKHALYG
jgi:hypothetical protein